MSSPPHRRGSPPSLPKISFCASFGIPGPGRADGFAGILVLRLTRHAPRYLGYASSIHIGSARRFRFAAVANSRRPGCSPLGLSVIVDRNENGDIGNVRDEPPILTRGG